jgi:C4-dicarboxylate-specific signal transduction histidine kinase
MSRPAQAVVVLFAIFIIALLWTAPTLRIRAERDAAIAAAIQQNANRAIALEQYVARTLEAANIASLHVAASSAPFLRGPRQGSAARPVLLDDPIARNKSFLGVSIVNQRGELVASTLGTTIAPQPVSKHEAFKVHARRPDGGLYVSRPAYSPLLKRDVLWLTRPIAGPDGSLAGVVSINIAPEQLTAIYEDVSADPSDMMSVIGLDGITRGRRSGAKVSSGEDLRGKLVMRMQQRDPNGTYLGPAATDGQVRYFSQRRLRDYPLFTSYGILEEAVLEPTRKRASFLYSIAALATLITLAFAATLIRMIRRRDEQASQLAASKQRLEEAQRVAAVGDWEFDLRTQVIGWSPQLLKMYGKDADGAPPTFEEFLSYLDEGSKSALDEAIRQATGTGEAQTYELATRLPSGTESQRLVTAIPVRDPRGEVFRLYGTDQDISARKKLDRLESELAHLSRLEAMSAMAATLAHELNQPLAAASNYLAGTTRSLRAPELDRACVEEGVERARQQVRFAGEIIRRVREMVTKERKAHGPVALGKAIDDALILASASGRHGLSVSKRMDPDAALVTADEVQLQQVLVNLIRNAREATAGVERPRVAITSERTDDTHALITVADNGPGFDDEPCKLFSPFTSESPTGLGLGLSISRTIVESHGGRMWAENNPDGGALVRFTLPLASVDGAASTG